jgi:hypothetical protein
LILVLLTAIGLLLIPALNGAATVYTQTNEPGAGTKMVQTFQMMAMMAKCIPPALSGGKDLIIPCGRKGFVTQWFVQGQGWEGAGAGIKHIEDPGTTGLLYYSHKGTTSNLNDPEIKRDPGYFIASRVKIMEDKGLIPDKGLFPLVINLATNSPERIKRRKFMADFFPALGKTPPSPLILSSVPGVNPTDSKNVSAVHAVVGFSLFKMLFDLELESWELANMHEWAEVMKPCAANKCACVPQTCKSTRAFFDHMTKRLSESAVGKKYLADAKSRGWPDPADRLREILFITLFAGFGGTGDTAWFAIWKLNGDAPKMLPLFRKDPEAFILEVARVYPAVAGMTFQAPRSEKVTLGNGRVYSLNEDDYIMNWNAGANIDPTVFGGPSKSEEYALEFRTGRENADRVMTWNGELREIRSCGHTIGHPECKKAARPCPGTFLAIHIAQEVTTYFADAMVAPKAEL